MVTVARTADEQAARPSEFLLLVQIALLIAVGLLIIFAFPYRHPRSSAAILTAMVLALVGFEYASFRIWHLLFDAAYPAAGRVNGVRR